MKGVAGQAGFMLFHIWFRLFARLNGYNMLKLDPAMKQRIRDNISTQYANKKNIMFLTHRPKTHTHTDW
jgi:hypothetical protein